MTGTARGTRRLRAALAICTMTALAAPSLASAEPKPFGGKLTCAPKDGVRLCPGHAPTFTPPSANPPTPPSGDPTDVRIPSFDGVPLDVDVTLPATGDGPFPTIVMLHGYGGNKTAFESSKPEGDGNVTYHYNNLYFAQRGYAVVNYTARGFGGSCGSAASRANPGCAKGWLHLKDRSYEARDTQLLLGKLVDDGIARPDALGATGISYGGGESIELAMLRDKTSMRPDSDPSGPSKETLIPWKSPNGTPLSLAAAWPRWPWSDLVASLVPNGHFLDFDARTNGSSRSPIGVPIQSYIEGLFASGAISGFYAPPRTDPSADLTSWNGRVSSGDPFDDPFAQEIVNEIAGHHQGFGTLSVPGASQTPAPLLIENGWTDDLFPPAEALRIYNDLRQRDPAADIALQFGDLGHARGQNKVNTNKLFNDQGSSFFDAHLKGAASPAAPAKGSVTTFTQTCPAAAPAGGPFTAASWPEIHPGAFRFGDTDPKASQNVASAGGNPQTASKIDPIAGRAGFDACTTVADESAQNTANYRAKVLAPFTIMGLPTVKAKIAVTGAAPQLDSRLWDVDAEGNQTLITRGAFRVGTVPQDGVVTFQLHGNGWRFEAGHTVKLELLGQDAPYLQANKEPFQIAISNLTVEVPALEAPNSSAQTSEPPAGITATNQIVSPVLGRGGAAPRKVRPRLRLIVRPGHVRGGTRMRYHFAVTTFFNKRYVAVRGATVRFVGHRMRTDKKGLASISLRLLRAQRRTAYAGARGYVSARKVVVIARPKAKAKSRRRTARRAALHSSGTVRAGVS